MKEPAILWEEIAIGNGIEKCISSQRSAQQTAFSEIPNAEGGGIAMAMTAFAVLKLTSILSMLPWGVDES